MMVFMLINGQKISDEIQAEITKEISAIRDRKPGLAMIQVGDNPASVIYVKRKMEACAKAGIHSHRQYFPDDIDNDILEQTLLDYNRDPAVDGILLQLPLPKHLNPQKCMNIIDPNKDVDGFHPLNLGRLLIGDQEAFVPCTPLGIRTLLFRSGIEITGKHVVILGRSLIVGKTLAALLMQNTLEGNATVTVVHSHSKDQEALCRLADILIVAIGHPLYVKKSMVKPGAVVIDVGINRINDPSKPSGYRLVGDVDFEAVKDICSAITPVPGGVGPMTIAMLLSNTMKSYRKRT